MSILEHDKKWMRKALALAKKGVGRTSPNPAVGAVIVRNGKLAGQGWHRKAGEAHAEIFAIESAGESCSGATLYVTLEPCSTFGRTPPCTDAIIKSGVEKVVVGCLDQNPEHSGRGLEVLKAAGIEVASGILEDKCLSLNEAFFHWIKTGTPFVLLKMAMTLDGKIATASGESKWITGSLARKRVDSLRLWADAVMVGGNTALKDRPSLKVRTGNYRKDPRRIIATSSLTATRLCKILPPGSEPEVVGARTNDEWLAFMKQLGAENVTALLVEGGGELAASLLNAGIVNKVEFHLAPKILGGRNSIPVVGGANPASLDSALKLAGLEVRQAGEDFIFSGYPQN